MDATQVVLFVDVAVFSCWFLAFAVLQVDGKFPESGPVDLGYLLVIFNVCFPIEMEFILEVSSETGSVLRRHFVRWKP